MTVKINIECEDNEISQDTWATKHSGDVVPTNDLVSLSWLQKDDILQITPLDGEEENGSDSLNSTGIKSQDREDTNCSPGLRVESQESYYSSPPVSEQPLSIFGRSIRRSASVSGEQFYGETTRYRSNPSSTITGKGLDKPNYSYTHLIFMAIESTPQKCMTVNQIYNWCESNFPFYKHAGAGWKNSLRHNLSINKSFKRLPRDSRNEPNAIVKCSFDVLCSQRQEHEDLDDDEGPGRGAFWTVEPRERATLLDAIKRTPWNNGNTSAAGCQSLNDSGSTNSVSAFPVGRFGLARSAPSQLLRAEGLGSDKFGSMVGESAPHIRLLYTSDGNVVATYDSSFVDPSNSGHDGTTDVKALVSDSTFFDHRYWSSPSDEATSIDSASAEVEWPAEEEEKYLNILRLLNETEATDTAKLNSPTTDQPVGDGFLSNEVKRDAWEKMIGTHILEDPKLVTKQRRKSRLLPTRINKCNECKENVAGCESCLAKRSEVLNSNYVRTTLKEYDLDVSNMLDCDQEPGPAGGPLSRNSNIKTLKPSSPTAANTDDNDNDNNSDVTDEKKTLKSEEIYASNEVYVTPSPYIDHEYSHCQAQLRRPEENQLVNKYNDNYFSERLTELMSLYPLVKAFVDTIVNDMNVDYETDGFDDGFSSSEQDMYSEDYDNDESQQIKDSNSHEQCDCDVTPPRRSYRRQSLQASDFSVRQRRPRIASRGIRRRRGGGARAMKLSASLNSNPTRRSKRVIKAPRRPYDDFENVDYYDYELDNDEFDRIVEEEEKGEEDEGDPRPSDVESENENQTNPPENHKYRKDFFLSKTLKRPYQAMIDSHSNSDNCDRYLSPSIDADYESSEADDNADDSYHHRYSDSAIQLSQIKSRKSSSTTYEINNVWTTVMKCSVNRRKIHESIATEDCHSTYLEHNRTKEKDLDNSIVNYEEEVVEEPLEQQQRSEQTAVDAAHLLMGMSQIQSFKKQSGCVNLDSSEDSSLTESTMTLSLETTS